MRILRDHDLTIQQTEALVALLTQLGRHATPQTIAAMTDSPHTVLTAVRGDGELMGTATVIVIETMSERMARLEDVVVSDHARGQGVGRALVQVATEVATQRGCSVLDLVTQPARTEAVGLYESAGFTRRDVIAFRHQLKQ